MQLDEQERGFSFGKEGPLDMRMDITASFSAKDLVNKASEEELGEIFQKYGEEPRWKMAAKAIVGERMKKAFETTKELAEFIAQLFRGKGARGNKKHFHPATLIFQALRIAVNQELKAVEEMLPKALGFLANEGRIGVMSFHSLEDRLVKECFKKEAFSKAKNKYRNYLETTSLKLLTKKPLMAKEEEIRSNPRSRSAKLRFAEKMIQGG